MNPDRLISTRIDLWLWAARFYKTRSLAKQAIESGKIKPRHDIHDPSIEAMVMDLNIIMQVKGSMPDIVFPHKKHTQWLDCSNCHPAIFIPQSGANRMSMAENLLGNKCGVCHGKVAFPLSACTKCHTNKKVIVKGKK